MSNILFLIILNIVVYTFSQSEYTPAPSGNDNPTPPNYEPAPAPSDNNPPPSGNEPSPAPTTPTTPNITGCITLPTNMPAEICDKPPINDNSTTLNPLKYTPGENTTFTFSTKQFVGFIVTLSDSSKENGSFINGLSSNQTWVTTLKVCGNVSADSLTNSSPLNDTTNLLFNITAPENLTDNITVRVVVIYKLTSNNDCEWGVYNYTLTSSNNNNTNATTMSGAGGFQLRMCSDKNMNGQCDVLSAVGKKTGKWQSYRWQGTRSDHCVKICDDCNGLGWRCSDFSNNEIKFNRVLIWNWNDEKDGDNVPCC